MKHMQRLKNKVIKSKIFPAGPAVDNMNLNINHSEPQSQSSSVCSTESKESQTGK